MGMRTFLRNTSAILAVFVLPGTAMAQTVYTVGGGTVTYTGPAPTILAPNSYSFDTTAANVTVNGVTLSAGQYAPLFVDRYDNLSYAPNVEALHVTFTGGPTSLTSTANDAFDVYNTGPSTTGDIFLDTSGTSSGNSFSAASGHGMDIEADTGPVTNATVITGADTITSTTGLGVEVFASGTASLTTAAHISGGYVGVELTGQTKTVLNLTGTASVSGNTGIDLYSGHTGTLNIGAGNTVTGNGGQPSFWPTYLPGDGAGVVSFGGQTVVNRGTVQGATYGIYLENYAGYECQFQVCQFTNPTGPSSITNSGTIGGTTASVRFDGRGANTLTLQTGSTLTGAAIGSTTAGATNGLILEGHGTAANAFQNFTTLTARNGDGTWTISGNSTFSGNLSTDATAALNFTGSNTFQNIANNGAISLAGGKTLTATGTFTNAGTLTLAAGAKVNVATYTNTGTTNLNGGTLDPAAINVQAGDFGGDGAAVGNVSVTGGTVHAGSEPGGQLKIDGNLNQTGGKLVFQIGSDGSGGFLESSLMLTVGDAISITGSDIEFSFVDGADPLAFFDSGAFGLDTFLKSNTGVPFSSAFDLASIFQGDTFDITAPGISIDSFTFDPKAGALALTEKAAVPEPASWSLLLAGVAALGYGARRKTRRPA